MAEYFYNENDHELICRFDGRLDTDASMKLQPEIETKVGTHAERRGGDNPAVVFDFSKVDFVTSAFIRICAMNAKHVGKQKFSIVNTNPFIKKTFKIAGLDGELNVS